MNLNMISPPIFFYVVYDFCQLREDYFVAAILSKKDEAEQYKRELNTSQDTSTAVVDRMTMEQVKLVLVKDRLMASIALVEKLLGP